MATVQDWAKRNFAVYIDNATSKRDFRAQLRGNRSALLWTVYLLAFIGIGMWNYGESVAQGTTNVVAAQKGLQDFYKVVMALLGGMVTLVAPALAATAIVIERERRSLDLVFSAPVSPKLFLVGKMLSAYRYTWMLLVLSLPVTAVCVMLGGATWGEVLSAYVLLSLHGLLYSAIALTVSSMAQKPVSALIWSYASIAGAAIVGGSMAGPYAFTSYRADDPLAFGVTMSPFAVASAAGTSTPIFGIHIPNWLLFGVLVLFLVRLCLLGAGSVLSSYGARETRNLRLTGLVGMVLAGSIATLVTASSLATSTSFSTTDYGYFAGNIGAALSLLLTLPLPVLVCYGIDGDRKFWPNGAFSKNEALRGTPAGGLPYILLMLGAAFLSVLVTAFALGMNSLTPDLFASVWWCGAFWTFCWSLGRLASALTTELRSARTIHVALLLATIGLPVPFLFIIDPGMETLFWHMYPLYPLAVAQPEAFGARFFAGALLLAGTAGALAIAKRRAAQPVAVPA